MAVEVSRKVTEWGFYLAAYGLVWSSRPRRTWNRPSSTEQMTGAFSPGVVY
jgi:hypothetical protein